MIYIISGICAALAYSTDSIFGKIALEGLPLNIYFIIVAFIYSIVGIVLAIIHRNDIFKYLKKENLNNLTYQSLNPNVFEVLENTLLNRLCDLGTDILDKEKFKVKKKQNKLIRESIDSEGIFINF
jgi:hypothetical protein